MANSYFQFQQFTVRQDRCAMKVGTDGTLLGAWAVSPLSSPPSTLLDIGTGTGLIALMAAQRFPQADITAIDIDAEAVCQARKNVEASPFAARIRVLQGDIVYHASLFIPHSFDAIVCNPPFFVNSLACPDARRTTARHASSLPYAVLMDAAKQLLSPEGELSVIIPFDCYARIEAEAALAGLLKSRECAVKTTPRKPPRRYLLAYRRKNTEHEERLTAVLEDESGERSSWYRELTKEFYLL